MVASDMDPTPRPSSRPHPPITFTLNTSWVTVDSNHLVNAIFPEVDLDAAATETKVRSERLIRGIFPELGRNVAETRIRAVPELVIDGLPALGSCDEKGLDVCVRADLFRGYPMMAIGIAVHELLHAARIK